MLLSSIVVCSDDKHPHRQPERHRHVWIFLRVAEQCYWGGWFSYGTWQRLRPVRLSHMAHRRPGLGFPHHVDLRNSHHCPGALHRCLLSSVLQCKNKWLLRRSTCVEYVGKPQVLVSLHFFRTSVSPIKCTLWDRKLHHVIFAISLSKRFIVK